MNLRVVYFYSFQFRHLFITQITLVASSHELLFFYNLFTGFSYIGNFKRKIHIFLTLKNNFQQQQENKKRDLNERQKRMLLEKDASITKQQLKVYHQYGNCNIKVVTQSGPISINYENGTVEARVLY